MSVLKVGSFLQHPSKHQGRHTKTGLYVLYTNLHYIRETTPYVNQIIRERRFIEHKCMLVVVLEATTPSLCYVTALTHRTLYTC